MNYTLWLPVMAFQTGKNSSSGAIFISNSLPKDLNIRGDGPGKAKLSVYAFSYLIPLVGLSPSNSSISFVKFWIAEDTMFDALFLGFCIGHMAYL